MKTLNEKFPDWEILNRTGGFGNAKNGVPSIFIRNTLQDSELNNYNICPSLASISADQTSGSVINMFWMGMDIYFHQHYGQKIINPMYEDVSYIIDIYGTKTITSAAKMLGFNILTLYGSKWDVLIKSLGILQYRDNDFKYKPLENYDRTESTSTSESHSSVETSKFDRTVEDYGTESNTKNGSMTVNTTGESATNGSTNTHSQKGFNSSSWNETDKDVATNQINQDVTTDFENYSDTHTWGSSITPNKQRTYTTNATGDTVNNAGTNAGSVSSHITGNIGITTSQEMLTAELSMRNNIIYQTICQDLAKYLSLSVY